MKENRRILVMLLVVCMMVSMLPITAVAATYTDVSSNAWYADAVKFVNDNGMMNGTGATTFSPDATTTRGMIVTILYRLEGEPAAAASTFTDVPKDAYYAKAVGWANANSVVNGYGGGKFGPNDSITREQMAAILYRYAKLKGYDTTATGDYKTFADSSKVSPYAQECLNWAIGKGLMNGVGGNQLNPQGKSSRAQVATILMRFCEKTGANQPDVTDLEPVTLTIMLHGSTVTEEAAEKVLTELNAYLKDKLNVTLEVIWGTWGDFDAKAVTSLAAGDNIDIYYTCNWSANEYNKYARDGYWVKLDDMMARYAPELMEVIPDGLWETAKTNGYDGMGVYAVPTLKDTATQICWDVNGTLLAELGYNVDAVCAAGLDYYSDEFEAMLKAAKTAKGADFYPLVIEPVVLERLVNHTSIINGDIGSGQVLSYYFDAEHPSKDTGNTIVNKFATDEFAAFAAQTYEYAQKGYISPNCQSTDTANDYRTAALSAGEYLFNTQSYAYGCEEDYAIARGIDVRMVPGATPYMDATSGQGAMMAISSVSENPERALMFLNLLNTDSKVMTMLAYGLEGYTYETNTDGTIAFTAERVNYSPWRNGLGNIRILPETEYEGEGYWKEFSAFYASAEALPYGGFTFDASALQTERAALSNVYAEYAFGLMSGALDPDTVLPEFLSKLDAAGMQKYLAAAQQQMEAYMNN